MLQFFRKHQHKFVGLFLVVLACIMMVSFGLDPSTMSGIKSSSQTTAVTVDNTTVSMSAFYKRVQLVEAPMKKQLGENYEQFRKFLNPEQKAVDSLIDEIVYADFFDQSGLGVSAAAIKTKVFEAPYFQSGISQASFSNYLRAIGMTSKQLEKAISSELLSEQLDRLLKHSSLPTDQEISAKIKRDNEKRSFSYMEISADNFIDDVDISDEAKLLAHYEQNRDSYREPRASSFSWVTFAPAEFMSSVEISDDDLEELYQAKKNDFFEKEKFQLKKIQVNKAGAPASALESMVSKSSDSKKADNEENVTDEKRLLAEELLEKLKNGADFTQLAKESSDDLGSKDNGGDIGWLYIDSLDKDTLAELKDLEPGKLTGVIGNDSSYSIYQLVAHQDARTKPLDEVKEILSAQLRKDDAPVYASAEADDFLHRLQQDKVPLVDFATKENRNSSSTKGMVEAEDTSAGVPLEVLSEISLLPAGAKQVVKAAETFYVVEVIEVRPSRVKEFEEVKNEVITSYKTAESVTLAKAHAEDLLKKAADLAALATIAEEEKNRLAAAGKILTDTTIPEKPEMPEGVPPAVAAAAEKAATEEAEAKKNTGPLKTTDLATRATLSGDIFADESTKRKLFTLRQEKPVLQEVISNNRTFFIAGLAEVTSESEDTLKEKEAELRKSFADEGGQRLMRALTASLRAKKNIVVNPDIFSETTVF
ncbi:MAG: SurA N-terminal domain-containing protein [bacterium]|nr:SurA N-terminal domain-containing protein [bacterium]